VVVALRLALELSLKKPPMEAQHALEALRPQDPATLSHAAKTRTNGDIVMLGTNGLAQTEGIRAGLFPTARICVDNARFLSPHWDEEVKSLKSDEIH